MKIALFVFIMGEFDLIERYFKRYQKSSTVTLALGDDCAVVSCPPNQQIAITTDTMVENVHFLSTISPKALAHKALASNLSDLASMGAKPKWISLALTLPNINKLWLKAFSDSLFAEMEDYQVILIGGDTTRGEKLSVTITAQGFLPQGQGLKRHLGKVGDYVFVSGTLGDSAAGLNEVLHQRNVSPYFYQRHFYPTPRIALGHYLLNEGYSTCAVDISDGLCADLGHIVKKSGLKAQIQVENLPLSNELLKTYSIEDARALALTGGEDYELCFTVSAEKIFDFRSKLKNNALPCLVTEIGRLVELVPQEKPQVELFNHNKIYPFSKKLGFDHFKKENL